MSKLFTGVWPALITPFTAENQIDAAVLRSIVNYHIEKGVSGFYVGGTTGEGIFMSVPERKLVIETVLTEVAGRVPIIVHVGSVALQDAVDLATYAEQQGAAGVSSIAPPYYEDLQSLTGYFTALAGSVPSLPVLPYFISQKVKPLDLVKQLLAIPNIKGTKYTGPDMFEFRQIIDVSPDDWSVFSGMDEECVFAAMMGSDGNIGSTLNFMPGVYIQIQQLVAQGKLDEAHALQVRANTVIAAMISVNFMGALKEVMSTLGFASGQPRLPRQPLTTDQRERLHSLLQNTDFAELVAL